MANPEPLWTAAEREATHFDEVKIYSEPSGKLKSVRVEPVTFLRHEGGAFHYRDKDGDEFHTTEPLPEIPKVYSRTVVRLIEALKYEHGNSNCEDGIDEGEPCSTCALLDSLR